jgi:hypothetical protein
MIHSVVFFCFSVLAPCFIVTDEIGPFETLIECRARAEEMKAAVLQAGLPGIPPGAPVIVNKECLPEDEFRAFEEALDASEPAQPPVPEPDLPSRPGQRT